MNRLITPPTALAVSLAAAKANLRIDGTDQDALLEAWIRGITEHAEHLMGRALISQGWQTTLDRFPDAIQLANPPVIAVQSIVYFDEDGVEQTLDPADYKLDRISEPGYIVPAHNASWPATFCQVNAVTVNYTCGYGETDASVPAVIKMYLLAKLAEQFDPATRPEKETVQSCFLDRILDRYRVY